MKPTLEPTPGSGAPSADGRAPTADASAPLAIVVAIAAVVAAVSLSDVRDVALLGSLPAARLLWRGAYRKRAQRRLVSLVPIALAAGFVRGWSAHSAGASFDQVIELVVRLEARVGVAALWTTWLGATYSARAIDRGLVRLGVPASLVLLLSLTRRFAGQLGRTATTAWSAAAVRGGFGSWRATGRTLGSLAGIVIVRALDRTERVSDAMSVRGYHLESSER